MYMHQQVRMNHGAYVDTSTCYNCLKVVRMSHGAYGAYVDTSTSYVFTYKDTHCTHTPAIEQQRSAYRLRVGLGWRQAVPVAYTDRDIYVHMHMYIKMYMCMYICMNIYVNANKINT